MKEQLSDEEDVAHHLRDLLVKTLLREREASSRAEIAARELDRFHERVDRDYYSSAPLSAPLRVWVIIGPGSLLPGGMFFHRKIAIQYAEQVSGIKWRKMRRMGYRCAKMKLSFP